MKLRRLSVDVLASLSGLATGTFVETFGTAGSPESFTWFSLFLQSDQTRREQMRTQHLKNRGLLPQKLNEAWQPWCPKQLCDTTRLKLQICWAHRATRIVSVNPALMCFRLRISQLYTCLPEEREHFTLKMDVFFKRRKTFDPGGTSSNEVYASPCHCAAHGFRQFAGTTNFSLNIGFSLAALLRVSSNREGDKNSQDSFVSHHFPFPFVADLPIHWKFRHQRVL